MNKPILSTLCALALVGCGESNQQKLEACMEKAERRFEYMSKYGTNKLGKLVCTPADKDSLPGDAALCDYLVAAAKQERIEEEDRCVKLYK